MRTDEPEHESLLLFDLEEAPVIASKPSASSFDGWKTHAVLGFLSQPKRSWRIDLCSYGTVQPMTHNIMKNTKPVIVLRMVLKIPQKNEGN
jgi:hypothetical protein